MQKTRLTFLVACIGLAASSCVARVSVSSAGDEANRASFDAAASATGRYVAFVSYASNLVADDTNGHGDIFVRDLLLGTTSRVSISTSGDESDAPSWEPDISDDGTRVVFWSHATTLVDDDTGATTDAFLHDLSTGTTTRLSEAPDGSELDGSTYRPRISGDGATVVFESEATDLVANDTNGARDVFAVDVASGTADRISLSTAGVEGDSGSYKASSSHDGQRIAFASHATNLIDGDTNSQNDIFVRDRTTDTTTRVSISSTGGQVLDVLGSEDPAISGDGTTVVFWTRDGALVAGDTNNVDDIFAHDLTTGTTTRVSVASNGTEGDGSSRLPSISHDGRFVAFESFGDFDTAANSLRNAFVVDRDSGDLELISRPNGSANGATGYGPDVSAGGLFVVFGSSGELTGAGDTNGFDDVFVWLDTD